MWLLFAYMYEFLHMDVLFMVWMSSVLFLMVNLIIAKQLAQKFSAKMSDVSESKTIQ